MSLNTTDFLPLWCHLLQKQKQLTFLLPDVSLPVLSEREPDVCALSVTWWPPLRLLCLLLPSLRTQRILTLSKVKEEHCHRKMSVKLKVKNSLQLCSWILPFFLSPFWALHCIFFSGWSTLGDMWTFLSGDWLFSFSEELPLRCFSKVWPLLDFGLAASASGTLFPACEDGCALGLLSCLDGFSTFFSSAFPSSVVDLGRCLVGE